MQPLDQETSQSQMDTSGDASSQQQEITTEASGGDDVLIQKDAFRNSSVGSGQPMPAAGDSEYLSDSSDDGDFFDPDIMDGLLEQPFAGGQSKRGVKRKHS